MRTINPYAKAWANAERSCRAREVGKAKSHKRMIAGKEFLDSTHLYERTFSDCPTGEYKVMNGRRAKLINDNLFTNYLSAMENNTPDRSLERWKVREKFTELPKD